MTFEEWWKKVPNYEDSRFFSRNSVAKLSWNAALEEAAKSLDETAVKEHNSLYEEVKTKILSLRQKNK